MNVELAAHILAKGKRLAPDRLPQPGPETAEAWAEALGEVSFPPALWSEAVTLWSTRRVGDRMATPRDLIGAALVVRDRWESVPEKAAVLEAMRVERANANYRRAGLEPIVAGDLPQHAPGQVSGPSGRVSSPVRLGEVPVGRW